jgi:hypothetical protein
MNVRLKKEQKIKVNSSRDIYKIMIFPRKNGHASFYATLFSYTDGDTYPIPECILL